MFNNAIILAGGEGVRMRPLTKYIPKGLIEVGERSLIKEIITTLDDNLIENNYITYSYHHLRYIKSNNASLRYFKAYDVQ